MDAKMKFDLTGIGASFSLEITKSGSGTKDIDESIADSETDLLVEFTLDISACQAFIMVSDQDLTVKTNSDSAPQETLTLVADEPVVFIRNAADDPMQGFAEPVLGDITALYVTNASGSAARLRIKALEDITPA